jgi:hypothetical protein
MSWVSGLQYTNKGPHGLSEILVACTTSMANNGQNFAGLSADTPFYSITPALAMRAGRFAQRRRKPITDGTLPPTRRSSWSAPSATCRCWPLGPSSSPSRCGSGSRCADLARVRPRPWDGSPRRCDWHPRLTSP